MNSHHPHSKSGNKGAHVRSSFSKPSSKTSKHSKNDMHNKHTKPTPNQKTASNTNGGRRAAGHRGQRPHWQDKEHATPMDGPEFITTIRINGKGVGSVSHPDTGERIEVPHEALNTALHGDTVRVALRAKRKHTPQSAEVCEVVTRLKNAFVGTLVQENGIWFLDADDRHLYVNIVIHPKDQDKAKKNEKALVTITRWNDPKKIPEGRIEQLIGPAGEHETEMRAVVLAAGFDYQFPPGVEQEAEEIQNKNASLLTEALITRRDMRDVVTFTIDPADAKDFDDAISVAVLQNGNVELGIHIADVSAYVKEGDPIDTEAQARGTSIYLVDRTIPMLPEVLSNDACSLNPGEDKLAMSAVFTFDANYNLIAEWFGETVINSNTRFVYDEAQTVIEQETGTHAQEIIIARDIARKERAERFHDGAIAFETDEIKFELDSNMKPVRVIRKERKEANLMIEDLMLLANKQVALRVTNECKKRAGDPCVFVYRIHDTPKPEKIIELATFVKALGFDLPNKQGEVKAKDLNLLFKQVEGSEMQNMIETAAIRSMAKAIYSLKNIGHFGLAFTHYCHFTSPIRRYPDLMVHRILKRVLAGKGTPSREYAKYERLAAQSTEREISAAEAERESIKYKQVEYMSTRIGQEFDGIVSGVTDWGLFVEEVETKADGMVRLRDLGDDYYNLAEHGYKLVGERTGRTIGLADKVRVKLIGVDLEHKMIDWKIVG